MFWRSLHSNAHSLFYPSKELWGGGGEINYFVISEPLDCWMFCLLCDVMFVQYYEFQPVFIELRIQDKTIGVTGEKGVWKGQSIILLSP
jgi:hypothetical protein